MIPLLKVLPIFPSLPPSLAPSSLSRTETIDATIGVWRKLASSVRLRDIKKKFEVLFNTDPGQLNSPKSSVSFEKKSTKQ